MRALARRFLHDERGVSAVFIGLCLSAILGCAALAVDVGAWYAERQSAQGAADAAAFSAAVDFAAKGSVADADTDAQSVAAQDGYVNGAGKVTVTVNSPPASGTHTSSGLNAFEVIVSQPAPLFFSALYAKPFSISARAVAVPATSVGSYCVLILNPTPGASNVNFTISGGAVVNLSSCGIADDGPGSCAISASGGAQIIAQNLSVVGNYCTSNGATVNITGPKATGAHAVPDPYASYSVAAAEGSTSMACPNGTPTSYASGGSKYTLNPGVYCGGLSIANGVTVTMNPGIYYVVGGTFSLQGGTTTTANGVTIVLTGSGSNYATANIANGVNLNLTAPSTGPSAGLAIWADKRGPTSNTSTIAGGATMDVTGSIYMPTQTVSFTNGTSNASACTQLVSYNVVFQGSSKFTNQCANSGIKAIGGQGVTALVE